MGAASKGGIICGICKQSRRKHRQIKGGIQVCKECSDLEHSKENSALRMEVHELKMQISGVARDITLEEIRSMKRVITPPEQRWDGY